ncbi:MAG: GNAT family N-acetyltransferase [Chloroflexi bacterium]|nr:GNAT family N-acetyltransferase [Chloroflexota bacterium]
MIVATKVRLREKRLEDAQRDYAWSKDPELSRLDATEPLTVSYFRYFSDYAGELHYPAFSRRRFAIETLDGKHIGNCSYYNIDRDKGETELGIMIGDRSYWSKGYGTDAVATLVNYVFQRTSLNRIYLKTLDWNMRAQKCFRKCLFTTCGEMARDGYKFLLMELYRSQWEKALEQESDSFESNVILRSPSPLVKDDEEYDRGG